MIKVIKNNFFLLKYVLRYAPGYALLSLAVAVLVAADNVIGAGILPRYLYDALSERESIFKILFWICMCAVLLIIRIFLHCLNEEFLRPRAQVKVASKLQSQLFAHAANIDLRRYDDPEFYDDFVFAMSEADVRAMDTFATFQRFFSCLLMLGGFAGVVASADSIALLFALGYFLGNLIIQARRVKVEFSRAAQAKPFERRRDYGMRVFTLPRYSGEIRVTDIGKTVRKELVKALKELSQVYVRHGKRLFGLHMAEAVILETVFLDAGLYGYLAYALIGAKTISAGEMIAAANSSENIIWRSGDIVNIVRGLAENGLFAEKIRVFLNEKPSIQGRLLPETGEKLELCDVTFAYPGRPPVLKGVSLTVRRGERVAIVGENGSGKSTLVKLLLRLYDPTEGEIKLDGRDIRELEPVHYRNMFGAAFQDAELFAATLAENVAMCPVSDSDEAKITEALTRAGFDKRLQTLDRGLQTELSKEFDERGVELSGGERQKVATSRAFFTGGNFAVLDEPSAALDPISEYELNRAIRDSEGDRALIFISHRLSTCTVADRIIVLKDGVVSEEGSHKELLEADGVYAEMWKAQASKYE